MPDPVPSLPAVPPTFQGFYLLEVEPGSRTVGGRWVCVGGLTDDLVRAQVFHTKDHPMSSRGGYPFVFVSARTALEEAQAKLATFEQALREEIPPTKHHVHPSRFGRDHWSTLAYAFSCLGNQGQLDPSRLRQDGIGAPTRLFGHTDLNPALLPGHSDLDCLTDLEAAGVLRNCGSGIHQRVQFTPAGLQMGQWICSQWGTSGFSSSKLTWSRAVVQSETVGPFNPFPPPYEDGADAGTQGSPEPR